MGKAEPRENLPETPKRNMESAIFVASLKDRFAPETPEGVYSSPRTSDTQQSDQTTDRVQNATKAIVHETHHQKSKEKIRSLKVKTITPNPATLRKSSSDESETYESKNDNKSVPTRITLPETPANDSTYI